LQQAGSIGPALDAKRLVAHALGWSDLQLATREHDRVDPAMAERVAGLLGRRIVGESVARIIGEREFYGLPIRLNAATLEPRPETELLVDLAIKALPQGGMLLDLGTGSGCIPVAVLANRPDAPAVAVDLSAEALHCARENAVLTGVGGRIAFLEGNWFEPLNRPLLSPGGGREAVAPPFDLIVSNPPYIASAIIPTLSPEVRDFDPALALDGGPDGLAPYRIIASQAGEWLKPGGQLLLEIGFDQAVGVTGLLHAAGFEQIGVLQDLNALDRVVRAHHF